MTLLRQIAGVVTGFVTVSCGDGVTFPVGTPPRGVITTDSLGYTARVTGDYFGHNTYEVRVVSRYENTTTSPVTMARCFPGDQSPVYSLVQVDGKESAYNPIWACVGGNSPIVVAPAAVRVDTFFLRGPNAFEGGSNRPFGNTEGRLRINYAAAWNCPSEGVCNIPDSLTLTNEFVVRVER